MFETFHNFLKSETVAVTLSQLLAGAVEREGCRNAEPEAGVGRGAGLGGGSCQYSPRGRGEAGGRGRAVQQPLARAPPAPELLVLPDRPQEPWLWGLSLPHHCVLLRT